MAIACEYAGAVVPAASPAWPKPCLRDTMERPISQKTLGRRCRRLVVKARIGLREHIHNSRGNRPVGSPSALLCERNRITFLKEARIMTKQYDICLLPGDGIGPEIIAEGVKVLNAVGAKLRPRASTAKSRLSAAPPSMWWATRCRPPRSTPRRPPMPCCLPPWAGRSGTPPTLARRAPRRAFWASARAWACTPTCAPCRSSMRLQALPRLSPRSSGASTL